MHVEANLFLDTSILRCGDALLFLPATDDASLHRKPKTAGIKNVRHFSGAVHVNGPLIHMIHDRLYCAPQYWGGARRKGLYSERHSSALTMMES